LELALERGALAIFDRGVTPVFVSSGEILLEKEFALDRGALAMFDLGVFVMVDRGVLVMFDRGV
jgi:hypothetical protein